MGFAIIGAVLAIIVIWVISVHRKLAVMVDNISNAMNQIGVQLASRLNALTALIDIVNGYAANESQALIEIVNSRCSVITAASAPDDVLRQEEVISKALIRISMVEMQYPELKYSEDYKKTMNAVDSYEKMVRTSCLIYNDSVTRFNRELYTFPTSLVGGILGFRKREYMKAADEKTDKPADK